MGLIYLAFAVIGIMIGIPFVVVVLYLLFAAIMGAPLPRKDGT